MKEELSREELLKKIEWGAKFGYMPVDIPEKYLQDRQFIIEALKLNGDVYRKLPEEMKKRDKEIIVLAAQKVKDWFFLNIDSDLYDDREFVLKLLSANGRCIWDVSKYIEIDEEMLLTAIAQNYLAAGKIPWERLHDREYALKIGKINGRTLSHFSNELRDDEEVVFTFASRNYRAFECASNHLKNDEASLMKLLFANPSCLAYAPKKYRSDRALAEKLTEIHPYVYRYLSAELKEDAGFAFKAVTRYPELCYYVPQSLRENGEFLSRIAAVLNDPELPESVKAEIKDRLRLKDN